MKNLKAKVAVITGAASGIGHATAVALAEEGCHLALVDLDETGLANTKLEAQKKLGDQGMVSTFVVNVADRAAMETLAKEVVEEFGGVDILINNAGINVTASFEDHTLEDFERVFAVNINGVVYGCHFFLPYLKQAKEAHIFNVSSAFGIVGVAGQTAYSASKFAVRGFSESLHEELADTGVRISVVHPGCINTNIVKTATIADKKAARDIVDYFEKNGAPPSAVARRIVRAIRKKEHRVLVTAETYAVDLLRRLAPQAGNRLANRVMARMMEIDVSVKP